MEKGLEMDYNLAASVLLALQVFHRNLLWSDAHHLGYFPRLLLCVPHATLIAIMTYKKSAVSDVPREGSVEWANMQAIQNLMGF